MTEILTSRVKAIKNDNNENVLISEINAAFDKFDNHFIPACKIRNSVVQAIPTGTPTDLQYNQSAYDSYAARSEGAMADLSNDRIVIRKNGLYFVKANIWTTTASATGVMRLDIRKNGTAHFIDQFGPAATIITQAVSGVIDCVNGDLLTVNANQTAGVSRNYTDNTVLDGFSFSAVWLGSLVEV